MTEATDPVIGIIGAGLASLTASPAATNLGLRPRVIEKSDHIPRAPSRHRHRPNFGRTPGWSMIPGFGSGPNTSLGAIAASPFYVVRLRPTPGAGGSGVCADASGRVLDWCDHPIDGLYCAGDPRCMTSSAPATRPA